MITPHGDNPQPASDRRIGQRFGDYVVEGQIGRGGMGVVFRARHLRSGEAVALKLMAPDLADNESFRERFVREAEAGPNLAHPNIVPVFESGEADGELFIAMQLIEGTDLKGLIEQEGRLDPKRVLSIFRQAASALDAAHESGMVHRDVKPQNILVIPRDTPEDTDRVYLTDFGLVRPVASETTASRTGTVFGSVPYMAPELIESIPADGRADVYALGCVLYECLTGSVPFERDNEVSAVWAHIHEDPPLLTDKCPDLPGGLNDVVIKAMQKHPDDRFLTCGEFITELELGMGRKLSNLKYAYVRPLVARIPRGKTEREVWAPNYFPELSRVRSASRQRLDLRKVIAFGVGVFMLLSVQVGREGGLPEAVADVADAAGSVGEKVLDTAFGGDEDVAGEDEVEVLAGAQGDNSDRRNASLTLPTAPTVAMNPLAGTDGDGTTDRASSNGASEPLIAYENGGEIYVVRPDGSGRRLLTDTANGFSSMNPQWSPDGRRILFATISLNVVTVDDDDLGNRVEVGDLYIINADGTSLTQLTDDAKTEGDPSWSPDGTKIAFHVRDDSAKGYFITVINADGSGTQQRITRGTNPDWSPNGRWIAFVPRSGYSSSRAISQDIAIMRADGADERLVTEGYLRSPEGRDPNEDRYGMDPAWSPDGRLIAFASGDEGTMTLSLVDPFSEVVEEVTDLTKMPVIGSPDWTPDGRRVIFPGRESTPTHIYVIHRDGTRRRLLIEALGGSFVSDPKWRPR